MAPLQLVQACKQVRRAVPCTPHLVARRHVDFARVCSAAVLLTPRPPHIAARPADLRTTAVRTRTIRIPLSSPARRRRRPSVRLSRRPEPLALRAART